LKKADEQIKPLTEEEKKAKLAELRQKLAEKRAKQSVEEIQVNKANEALRRKAGQVRSLDIVRDVELTGRMLER
jgi:ribosomal protein L29